MNLAVNAQDAMPRGGILTVSTSDVAVDKAYAQQHAGMHPGHYVLLTVSDTGVGMDKDVLAHVFEPFFTTKPVGKGTGLGLATVYGIVKQHDGHILVYSEPGMGTTLRIYFPLVNASPEDMLEPVCTNQSRSGNETVLVVEDNEPVRSLVCGILAEHGYTVLNASSSKEGLRIIQQHSGPIHLLLTDVVMPDINGRVLHHEASRCRSELKVLYMSGYSDDVIAHHGVLEEGAQLLPKPFSNQTLSAAVRKVLDGQCHRSSKHVATHTL
jgi:CheY-like chemotaxis protein